MKKTKTNLTTRSSPLSIDQAGVPKTLDDENRSVGVVATTICYWLIPGHES